MTDGQALRIVLDLAIQNIIEDDVAANDLDLRIEQDKQIMAVDTVQAILEDYFGGNSN